VCSANQPLSRTVDQSNGLARTQASQSLTNYTFTPGGPGSKVGAAPLPAPRLTAHRSKMGRLGRHSCLPSTARLSRPSNALSTVSALAGSLAVHGGHPIRARASLLRAAQPQGPRPFVGITKVRAGGVAAARVG